MKNNFRILILLLFFLTLKSRASSLETTAEIDTSKIKIIFDSKPMGNLTYQLDCLAELIHCSPDSIKSLWKTKKWSAADDSAIHDWADLQQKYRGFQLALPEGSQEERKQAGFPLRHRGISFGQKFRLVGFTSDNLNEYRKGLSFIMLPEDAEKAAAIAGRFQPRFTKWWDQSGKKKCGLIY